MTASSLGRTVRSILLTAGAGTGFISAPQLAAQTAPTIVSAALSADTVGIGDVFELTVSVGLRSDQVVYFPDSEIAVAMQINSDDSRVSVHTMALAGLVIDALEPGGDRASD